MKAARRKKEAEAKKLETARRELAYEKCQADLKVDHEPKKPAPAFLKRFHPHALSLGTVTLLKATVTSVAARHKGGTLIFFEADEDLGRIVCRDPRAFGADGMTTRKAPFKKAPSNADAVAPFVEKRAH